MKAEDIMYAKQARDRSEMTRAANAAHTKRTALHQWMQGYEPAKQSGGTMKPRGYCMRCQRAMG